MDDFSSIITYDKLNYGYKKWPIWQLRVYFRLSKLLKGWSSYQRNNNFSWTYKYESLTNKGKSFSLQTHPQKFRFSYFGTRKLTSPLEVCDRSTPVSSDILFISFRPASSPKSVSSNLLIFRELSVGAVCGNKIVLRFVLW